MIDVTSRFVVALRDELMKIGKDADCLSEEEIRDCLQRARDAGKKPTLEKLGAQVTCLTAIVEQMMLSYIDGKYTSVRAKDLVALLRDTNRQIDDIYR